tara:strand:- start:193 stop:636 length:444 start_codon:yes stop_codon:yes gene_type:complete
MKNNFEIRSPSTSEEWKNYENFRWEVLRKPLKMSHIPLQDNFEEISIHLMGITLKQKVIACGRFHLNNPNQGQIRYMGVSKNYRRLGIGSKLVKELEKLAMNHGANNILLNARNNIVDFYKSLNYEVIGPYTSDIQIPHSTMKKNLY